MTAHLTMFLPDVADRESVREWIVRIDDVRRHAGDPRLTAEGRYDCCVLSDLRLLDEAAREHRSQHSGMPEVLVEREFSFRVERRHLGAGTRTARRAIDRTRPCISLVPIQRAGRDDESVLPIGVALERRP